MKTWDIDAAKAGLPQLIDAAIAGREVIITRAGRPVAKLIALNRPKRRLGALKGRWHVPADFDAPLRGNLLVHFGAKT